MDETKSPASFLVFVVLHCQNSHKAISDLYSLIVVRNTVFLKMYFLIKAIITITDSQEHNKKYPYCKYS